MRDLNKFRGCLIGGAAGDALGYAVEFRMANDIFSQYGESGITSYALTNGIAEISDDTQMTLFTANGLLYGATRVRMCGIGNESGYLYDAYRDWYATQTNSYPAIDKDIVSWLMNVPGLFCRRAPGNTCLSALSSGKVGTMQIPINRSKGCGGVMRVAPIGIYYADSDLKIEASDMIAADAAAITHGHELGYIPAAALAHIVRRLAETDGESVREAVLEAMRAMPTLFPEAEHLQTMLDLLQKAIDLADSELDDLDAIRQLGAGWVAEETLAIAVYCAVKHEHSFEKALVASVNHDGDSDSTGAVTGNILGTRLGYGAIPRKFLEKLELRNVIVEIADDLFQGCRISEHGGYYDPLWESKYIKADFQPLEG